VLIVAFGILVVWQLVAIDWTQPMLPIGEHLGREQLMLDVGRGLAASLPANAVVAEARPANTPAARQ